jgi:hypothetical protein
MKIRNKAKLKLFGEVIFLNYFLVAFVEVCIMSHTLKRYLGLQQKQGLQ